MVNVHEFDLGDGWKALVGKTDAENDRLTFKVAFPQDWWLHVNGCPGSHVILQNPDEDTPPKQVANRAAELAAWFSKARNAGTVSVHLARISDIRKPRGAKSGTVTVRKGKTLKVRPVGPGKSGLA